MIKNKLIFKTVFSVLLMAGSLSVAAQQKIDTLLLDAVLKQNSKLTEKLLNKGADINAQVEYQLNEAEYVIYTPLLMAARQNNLKLVKLLVGKGAQVNYQDSITGSGPFHFACYARNQEMMKYLIQSGADMNAKDIAGNTALMWALENEPELAVFLLQNGANVNIANNGGESPMLKALLFEQPQVISLLVTGGALNHQDSLGRTPIMQSVMMSDMTDNIIKMIQYGADLSLKDNLGKTALDYAVEHGRKNIQELILSPVLSSLKSGYDSIAFVMLEANRDAASQTDRNGRTLLHIAVEGGYLDFIRKVMSTQDKSMLIDRKDTEGQTPLLYAVFVGDTAIAHYLITEGADINAADKNLFTPLYLSKYRGYEGLVRLLEERNAKELPVKLHPELVVPSGHSSDITCCTFSSDGKMALTASNDGMIKLWDIASGKEMRTFRVGQYNLQQYYVEFSKDGKFLGVDRSELWDLATGRKIRDLMTEEIAPLFNPHCFSPDDGYHEGTSQYIFDSPLVHSPDNTKIAFYKGKKLTINHIQGARQGLTIEGHHQTISALCFTQDSKYLLSAAWEHDPEVFHGYFAELLLWDVQTGKLVKDLLENRPITAIQPVGGTLYAIGFKEGDIVIFDLENSQELQRFPGQHFSVSPDKKTILVADGYSTTVYEIATARAIKQFKNNSTGVSTFGFSHNGTQLVSGGWATDPTAIRLWDLSRLNGIRVFPEEKQIAIQSAVFSPDDKYLLTLNNRGICKIWNNKSSQPEWSFNTEKLFPDDDLAFSYDRKSVLFLGGNGVGIFDPEQSAIVQNQRIEEYWPPLQFFHKHNYALYRPELSTYEVMDIESGTTVNSFQTIGGSLASLVISPDDEYLAQGYEDGIVRLIEMNSGRTIKTLFGHEANVASLDFSSDGKLLLSGSWDETTKLWDVEKGVCLHTYSGNDSWVRKTAFHPSGKLFLSSYEDHSMKLFSVDGQNELVTYFCVDSVDWIVATPDMYYAVSKGALKQLAWVIGLDVYNFEQFDLQYNRPDVVLERIGLADSNLIKAYRNAYYKRLRKMNFEEGMFSPDFHTPELTIVDQDKLPDHTADPQITLRIRAFDSKYKLDRINIWVNDVPVFGMEGIGLRALPSDSIDKDITLSLSQGENKIQFSCLNEKGIESLRQTQWITYTPGEVKKSKTYLLAISVSGYKNPEYDLKLAVKDGRDMAHLIAATEGAEIDTLFNALATREHILAMKQKLMQTDVDDKVILYVSGHGMLDKNYDFYFATYDMNFQDPAQHGILYEELEGLLDGIPARRKLLLMDACHSGEVDKEETAPREAGVLLADGQKGAVKTYGSRGVQIGPRQSVELGLQNSFELMQELFTNLTRGSGAVVISAAAGTGYALESPEWNNGVFTYCILEGLKNYAADANGDRSVTVTELKDYVCREVDRLTKGAQKPTSRRERLEFDWPVW